MSRCFPYPPPGFEKKTRSDHADLLAKEKHKERKHKKEKRDKEKKEGKEKKDKDKSKDKKKEKKDRKERHKDKRRNKDKNRTSDDKRIEGQTGVHNEQKVGWSMFTEELGRENKYETGTANRMPENFSGSISKAEEVNDSRFSKELDRRVEVEKKVAVSSMLENVAGSIPKRVESLGTSAALEKEKGNGKPVAANFVNKEKRKAHEASLRVEKANHNHQGLPSGNPMVAYFPKEQRRADETGQPVPKDNHKHQALSYKTPVISNFNGTEESRVDKISRTVEKANQNHQAFLETPDIQALLQTQAEKDEVKSSEGKEKGKDREADNGQGDRRKDRKREEKKNKGKDNNRNKEKGKEEKKKSVKGENSYKEHGTPNYSGRDQADSQKFKPLAPDNNIENFPAKYGNGKKRKIEMNGFLHEGEGPSNKLPRHASSSHQQNGKTLDFDYIHTAYPSSVRHDSPNNIKAERQMHNKEHTINGTVVAQPSPSGLKPSLATDARRKSKTCSKPPHPDSMFLREIYSVPEMEKWPEYDDQEWLFSSSDHQLKSKAETEAEGTPQVWAEGLKIESADVFALPYVIPY